MSLWWIGYGLRVVIWLALITTRNLNHSHPGPNLEEAVQWLRVGGAHLGTSSAWIYSHTFWAAHLLLVHFFLSYCNWSLMNQRTGSDFLHESKYPRSAALLIWLSSTIFLLFTTLKYDIILIILMLYFNTFWTLIYVTDYMYGYRMKELCSLISGTQVSQFFQLQLHIKSLLSGIDLKTRLLYIRVSSLRERIPHVPTSYSMSIVTCTFTISISLYVHVEKLMFSWEHLSS